MRHLEPHRPGLSGHLEPGIWSDGDDAPVPPVFDAGPGHPAREHRAAASPIAGTQPAALTLIATPALSSNVLASNVLASNAVSPNVAAALTALPAIPASPSAFTIAIAWDTSVGNAPAGFTTDVIAAVQYLETRFTDAVTIHIDVGYGEVAGNGIGGALGSSLSNIAGTTYAQLRAALNNDATTATDTSVLASLPSNGSPIAGATYWTTSAQAKALGLSPANGSGLDGSAGFGLSPLFTYGLNETGGTVAPGTYDFFATVLHELTEVMGRQLLAGISVNGVLGGYDPLDLLHYSASGTLALVGTTPGYFSIDGGLTNLGNFNTAAGGDPGDWASSVVNDPFDAFASNGVSEPVSAADLTLLDAIGWNLQGSSPLPAPTGVTINAATGALSALQGTRSLAANGALATLQQSGGVAGDSFTYALGGASAASFAIASGNLTAGKSAVFGAAGGRLYALTVTANDTTIAKSPAPVPLDVVIGGSSGDTIDLAALSGSLAAATPTFVYGLAGGDTILGAGMTGHLTIAGGLGADTMTGGSGGNTYVYGAASESSPGAMDIVTNFQVVMDSIDLTGPGAAGLTYRNQAGPSASSLAAHSVVWRIGGGDTFIYANTSGATESLGATDMRIELQGAVPLTAANFRLV